MTAPDTITTGDGRTIQLSELEAKARAATPGPREAGSGCGLVVGADTFPMADVMDADDAAHIAAFDRETCLALIAEVRRQAEDIAQVCAERDALYGEVKARDSEIASLRERVAELEVGHGTTSIRPVFPIQSEDMP